MDGLFAHKLAPVLRADQSSPPNPAAEAYRTYEDIGTFLFVIVVVNAVIGLAERLHFLNSSDLIALRLARQALIISLLGLALYAILKLRSHRPVIRPLGWLVPSRIYVAISILGGVVAVLAITYFTPTQG